MVSLQYYEKKYDLGKKKDHFVLNGSPHVLNGKV